MSRKGRDSEKQIDALKAQQPKALTRMSTSSTVNKPPSLLVCMRTRMGCLEQARFSR